jgi:hypothetical protein
MNNGTVDMSPDDVVYSMLMTVGAVAGLIWTGYGVRVYRRWRERRRA